MNSQIQANISDCVDRQLEHFTGNTSFVPGAALVKMHRKVEIYIGEFNDDNSIERAKVLNVFLNNLVKRYRIRCEFLISLKDEPVNVPGSFCSSKHVGDNFILFPNFFLMCDLLSQLKQQPDTEVNKKEQIHFRGSTTGFDTPNKRIAYCLKYKDNSDFDLKITKLCQGHCNLDPGILAEYEPHHGMYRFKYLLNIDGNVTGWNRLPIILQSRSLCFKDDSTWVEWWYDLLAPYEHYIPCNIDNVESRLLEIKDKDVNHIIDNANKVAADYLSYRSLLHYTATLLKRYSRMSENH